MKDFSNLPDGLPVPTDDGKADHLTGSLIPSVVLRGTKGSQVLLDALPQGRTVIYVYPMTGKPGVDLPTGWDEVPGARGCTPESCGFRDNFTRDHVTNRHFFFKIHKYRKMARTDRAFSI